MTNTTKTLLRALALTAAALSACGPNQTADAGADADLFDVILRPDTAAEAAAEASTEASTEAGGDAGEGEGGAAEAGADATADAIADATTEGGAGDGGSCRGADNCYSCEPTESSHFLDRCTDGRCARFDNAARLPLYNGGVLPPLP